MENATLDNSTEYAQNLEEKLDRVHLFAQQNLRQSSTVTKRRYDTKVLATWFDEGSGVWLHNPQRKKGKSPKITKRWEGDVIVRIQRRQRTKPKIVHVNHLKPYHGNESLH